MDNTIKETQEKWVNGLGFKEPSIESPSYKKFKKAYQYAMDMTQKELDQAVEGMYHNLNERAA